MSINEIEILNVKSLQELHECYVKAVAEKVDDVEELHIIGDDILIKALELASMQLASIHDRNRINKIIELFKKSPAWYS